MKAGGFGFPCVAMFRLQHQRAEADVFQYVVEVAFAHLVGAGGGVDAADVDEIPQQFATVHGQRTIAHLQAETREEAAAPRAQRRRARHQRRIVVGQQQAQREAVVGQLAQRHREQLHERVVRRQFGKARRLIPTQQLGQPEVGLETRGAAQQAAEQAVRLGGVKVARERGQCGACLLYTSDARAALPVSAARQPGSPVDPAMGRLYIRRQPDADGRAFFMANTPSETLDITALEARVDALIRTIDSLQHENEALRSQQAALSADRAALIEKTEQARSRVEAMIARLKAMETR